MKNNKSQIGFPALIILIFSILLHIASGDLFAQEKAVKVGFIFPENGEYSQIGKSILMGFEYFLKSKSAGKTKFEAVRKDPGFDDKRILECLAELLAKDVKYIVGPASLKGSEQLVHALSGGKAILFITNPGVSLVGGELCLPNVFRLSPNSYHLSHPAAPWAIKRQLVTGFITGENSTAANEQGDFFAYGFERSGGHFADRKMLDPNENPKATIDKIGKSEAKMVFGAFSSGLGVSFIRDFRASGFKTPIIVSSAALSGSQGLSGKDLEDVFVLSAAPALKDFAVSLRQKMKKEPPLYERGVEGFELGLILSQIAASKETDQAKIIEFIENFDNEGPRGKITFDKNHERVLRVFIQEFKKAGNTVSLQPVDDLGSINSPDFGCGRVGFPKRPEIDIKDDEPFWDEREQ